MTKIVNYGLIVLIFLLSSAGIYLFQFLFFHDPEHTFFLILQNLAFLPIQALVVTLLLNKFLNMAQKQQNLKKINVVTSAFFSELGTSILSMLSKLNENYDELCRAIDIPELNRKNMNTLKKSINEFNFKMDITPEHLASLGLVLIDKKSFMIGLLQNSNLLEHDSFTDMLWAVFHVADELQDRNLQGLSQNDLEHLTSDILRAYRCLIIEWVDYMEYLRREYPYLYISAVRKSPFR
ncbi:hypothetical protein SPSYN_03094 [Sporotomaculum syntrophicum]|uniref:Uncharacterized protein n=1 Tax=Sporotomaculum syntrophicum TaxID=182264 RepID=A0A9D2WLT3_9FIRM|nr:hypothetical protein [Sporotomaculum syntrophicum]KAF1083745.1 hypothetical protein SPSYN_03094 [Sporotomaculum syntrophicum]